MRIALLQYHSNNNTDLFKLTSTNHIKYCEKHGYDMIFPNCVYTPFLDRYSLSKTLSDYDVVFCAGSDIIFTDISTPITKFITDTTGNIALYIAEEGRFEPSRAFVNFDLNIWINNPSFNILMNEIEYLESEIAKPFSVPVEFGTQSTIDYILLNNGESKKNIKTLKPRQLQSLPVNHSAMIWSEYNKNNYWEPGDFSVHFLTRDNKWKYDNCKKFMDDYPDLV